MVSKQQKEQKKKEWNSFYVEVPLEEANAEYDGRILTVNGPKGSISKRLKYPFVNVKVKDGKVVIGTECLTKREKKIIFTYQAHAKNMIKGVTESFEYKLAVVYAKFPVTVESKDGVFLVKNLLGEKVPRTVSIPEDVVVKVAGKDITVTGIDKEKTGQVAANIEQMCRVTNMDRRVVQDGIFITKKPHREYV
jgi:large subunit ribosomal protein L6